MLIGGRFKSNKQEILTTILSNIFLYDVFSVNSFRLELTLKKKVYYIKIYIRLINYVFEWNKDFVGTITVSQFVWFKPLKHCRLVRLRTRHAGGRNVWGPLILYVVSYSCCIISFIVIVDERHFQGESSYFFSFVWSKQ